MGGVRCLGLFPKKESIFFYAFPYGNDKDVYCPDDQVQPDWLDSTIEMRLSNLPSTAPGDKCAGMWEFAIGY